MLRLSRDSGVIYRDLPKQSRRLDARSPRYRFDIEADVRWDLLGAAGLHVVPSMVDGAGIDSAILRSNPEVGSLFDWGYGLAVCRVFVALEEVILDFERRARSAIAATKSLTMLCEDEVKHMDLFRRYARHLERRHPERMAAFERAFAQAARGLASVGEGLHPPESPAGHYVFWVNTLLFEELTVYYHERLGRPPEDALVQPAWRSVHAAHRLEELQHLVTDEHYLEALDLGPEERDELSQMTALLVVKHFNTTLFPFAVALGVVEETHPALPQLRSSVPTTRTPLFREVITGPCLKRTRRNAPAVDRLGTSSSEPLSPLPVGTALNRLSSQPGETR
jgi:hypothetical protein